MRRTVSWLFLMALLLAGFTAAAETQDTARVNLKPPVNRGQKYEQTAIFSLGTKHGYSIDCWGVRDASQGKGGYILGIPRPKASGWWCYGSLNIIINGQEASTVMLNSMAISEQGRRAMVDSVWHMEAADVRIRLVGLPGRELLFFEITVDPKQEIESMALKTLCFPAYFTSYHGGREQARFVQTPSRLIREVEVGRGTVSLDPKDNWWLLYGDEFFDFAKTRESGGPNAMMVLPETVSGITIDEIGYPVSTTVSVVPKVRKLRMAFWEMLETTNAEAVDYFRAGGDSIRRELATLDFTPELIETFDLSGMSAEIERFSRAETVGADFQKKAAELLAWIENSSANLSDKSDSVNATESKLQLRDQYAGFIYEARLAEMLACLEKGL